MEWMERLPTDSLIQTGPVADVSIADWLLDDEAAERYPSMEPWPWPRVKVQTGGWETLSSVEWVRPGFVSLNREVMSHTKLPSSQPAGMQLACTKRSARVGLRPNAGLFQRGSHSSPAFHFICTRAFMSGCQADMCLSLCAFLAWLTSTLLSFNGRCRLWGVDRAFDRAGPVHA